MTHKTVHYLYQPLVMEGELMTVRKNKTNNHRKSKSNQQDTSVLTQSSEEHLDISTLETWLWDAACAIRGIAT